MGKVEQYNGLVEQIVTLVQQSKQQVARSVNQTITLTYWQIGSNFTLLFQFCNQ